MAPEIPIPRKLWEHSNLKTTAIWKFKSSLEQSTGLSFPDYDSLYKFSCGQRSRFWRYAFQYFPIVYSGAIPDSVVDENAPVDSIPQWFRGVKMNFAQNILFTGDRQGRPTTVPGKEDDKVAVTEVREGSSLEPIRHTTWKDLRYKVGRLSQAMRAAGIQKGDRVAVVASTSLDTLTVFLATASLGALFSSSSTDMGTKAILERLTLIRPKFLFMDDTAVYNRKILDLRPTMKEIANGMRKHPEFKGIISQARFPHTPADVSSISGCQTWTSFISETTSSELYFAECDFGDPLLVVYSSGTTGQPKCIVHGIGGVVLNSYKDFFLHRAIDRTSVQLQYTTTAWIMYTLSVQVLLIGGRMITYDGSPFVPDLTTFLRLVGQQKVTHLGISPKYLHTLLINDVIPKEIADLSSLRVVSSTGMVLSDSLFEWFYDKAFPPHVHLANGSGGTDIAGAFAIANPMLPLYVGGCQCLSLGIPVKVYDQSIEGGPYVKGKEVEDGVPGELVATAAFPTMPIMFLDDKGNQRYKDSYFARFDGVWTHGDLIMIHPVTKQVMMLGRADGVLNPSGVRFGSAEIYSVMDSRFSDKILDSICVGQRRPNDADESVILFVLMKPGMKFTESLKREIKKAIRDERTPRHVPKYIFETPEIPTTVNMKKVELPVKQIVSGKVIKPSGTLLNPKSLDYYYQFAKDENLAASAQAKL